MHVRTALIPSDADNGDDDSDGGETKYNLWCHCHYDFQLQEGKWRNKEELTSNKYTHDTLLQHHNLQLTSWNPTILLDGFALFLYVNFFLPGRCYMACYYCDPPVGWKEYEINVFQ